MKEILVFLTTGFEEIEALATIDVLRRANLDVKTVSLENSKQVIGSHNIPVLADLLFDEADFNNSQMLVLPGGTVRINEHQVLKDEIMAFNLAGKNIAAICAAPMVFGELGILKGKRATCYPGFEKYLDGATLETDKAVIVDKNVITGRGPGLSIEFALTLVETIAGKTKRKEVAAGLLLD